VAEVNYLADPHRIEDGEALRYYADFGGATNVRLAPKAVRIRDARGLREPPSLAREGVVLARAPTTVRSVRELDAGPEPYLRECEALVAALTGAVRTFCTGLHCRFDQAADPKRRYDNTPTRFVHADFSDRAARAFAGFAPFSVPPEARFAIYNLWRVLTPPPQSTPLALLDAASVESADEVESNVVMAYPDREAIVTQTTLYRPSPRHRWLWFSDMTPDEVLVFASHDTDPARPKRVAHTAFADPSRPPGHGRISLESRVLAVFEG
jgi:hypothetical protein